jgi:ribonuclease HI
MTASVPHYLLFSEARASGRAQVRGGRWHFVLEPVEGGEKIEAADAEIQFPGERLELLAVIRGLEALEQPSRVTLVTPSRYVLHGLKYGLHEWRENDWQWERFGETEPVTNGDLWQRLDHALRFHQVDCRPWEGEEPDDLTAPIPAARSPLHPKLPGGKSTNKRGKKFRFDKPHKGPRSKGRRGFWARLKSWAEELLTAR